jgi:hypothetical protein
MNIEKNTTFGGYSAQLTAANNKFHYMNITDYKIDADTNYEFRYVTKCAAGFMVINDTTCKIGRMTNFRKNMLQTIQWKSENGMWLTIFAVKGGKMVCCDKGLLDVMIPNDFHNLCPKMVGADLFNFWKKNGITNATPGVFGDIEAQANEPMTVQVIG